MLFSYLCPWQILHKRILQQAGFIHFGQLEFLEAKEHFRSESKTLLLLVFWLLLNSFVSSNLQPSSLFSYEQVLIICSAAELSFLHLSTITLTLSYILSCGCPKNLIKITGEIINYDNIYYN